MDYCNTILRYICAFYKSISGFLLDFVDASDSKEKDNELVTILLKLNDILPGAHRFPWYYTTEFIMRRTINELRGIIKRSEYNAIDISGQLDILNKHPCEMSSRTDIIFEKLENNMYNIIKSYIPIYDVLDHLLLMYIDKCLTEEYRDANLYNESVVNDIIKDIQGAILSTAKILSLSEDKLDHWEYALSSWYIINDYIELQVRMQIDKLIKESKDQFK